VNLNTVNQAAVEAQRFLKTVAEWNKAEGAKAESYYSTPKESGAVRRASMDLTRALAELRKPG